MCRCEEEREYLRKQQGEVEHKLEVVCKTEADAKAEAKHAQLRYEDRDHELNERAALLRRQETELVRQPARKEKSMLLGDIAGGRRPLSGRGALYPKEGQDWEFGTI